MESRVIQLSQDENAKEELIPSGWRQSSLDQASKVIDCKHRTPPYVKTGIPVVSPGSIAWGELDLISPTKRVSDDEYSAMMDHCEVDVGDLVLSRNQSVGVASYISNNLPFVLGQDTVLIKPIKIEPKFLFYCLQSDATQRAIYKIAGGSTFSRINLADIRKLRILEPTSLEQTKIAKILSTWDRAIATTEKLIANSKAQKKALMQQLLTGKRRLPGFDGKWEELQLSQVTEILVSNVDKKTNDSEVPVRLCNYTDVYYHGYITDDMGFMVATATKAEINKFTLFLGDVLITKDSETPDDIAVPALVNEEMTDVVCGYHLAIVRPDKDQADGAFLSFLFSLPDVRHYFFTLANGATRFGLSIHSIRQATFKFPCLNEQRAVSGLLVGQDSEISKLQEQKRALLLEKQALMQQLLTGKRRVKVDQRAA